MPDEAIRRPIPRSPDRHRWVFTRAFRRSNPLGTPRGIAWFGFRSFWGHLQHFLASAIATEEVDTRDWMEPTAPPRLLEKVAAVLDIPVRGESLVESLGRDVWIDFVADTGDDGEVSQALGRLLFQPYRVPDPSDPSAEIVAPRGDVLVHGGDVAYPVATADQIHDRLVVPWNRALRDVPSDGRTRVLLGIPGNHDWYDGIDGFARLFRERHLPEEPEPPTEPLELRWLPRALRYFGTFLSGETVNKAKALVLSGYKPVQRASYFILPLTRKLHMHAVDRQLRRIDYRQKRFFLDWRKRHPGASRLVILPDPVLPFGRPSKSGLSMLRSLRLSPDREPHLCFAGDIHHYRRETIGKSVHVTAGGGGAFLHPAPLTTEDRAPAEVEWPGRLQCRTLLHKVAIHIAAGRSGLIAHAVLLLFFAPALGIGAWSGREHGLMGASIAAGLLSAVAMAFIGGVRSGPVGPIVSLAVLAGTLMGLVPTLTLAALHHVLDSVNVELDRAVEGFVALATALAAGGFLFGSFLAALTLLGYESTQAFTALSHPGFRHFVRMRVRADESAVDVFCIGLEDPLANDEPPVLVDAFTWEVPPDGPPRRASLEPPPS